MDGNGETTIFYIKIWFIIQLKHPFKKWLVLGFQVQCCIRVKWLDVPMIIHRSNDSPRWHQSFRNTKKQIYIVGGRTNPFEKYARQIGSFLQIGMKIKNLWNHQLEIHLYHRYWFRRGILLNDLYSEFRQCQSWTGFWRQTSTWQLERAKEFFPRGLGLFDSKA